MELILHGALSNLLAVHRGDAQRRALVCLELHEAARLLVEHPDALDRPEVAADRTGERCQCGHIVYSLSHSEYSSPLNNPLPCPFNHPPLPFALLPSPPPPHQRVCLRTGSSTSGPMLPIHTVRWVGPAAPRTLSYVWWTWSPLGCCWGGGGVDEGRCVNVIYGYVIYGYVICEYVSKYLCCK